MSNRFSRRNFLRLMGYTTGGLILSGCRPMADVFGAGSPSNGYQGGPMPLRPLGSTGMEVSLFGLGGEAAIESSDEDLAAQIINDAIDNGVNYLDTSRWYGGGQSERNIGEVMKTRRDEVFLATKSHSRTESGVLEHIDKSLADLKTDHIDLYQLHDVRTQSDLDDIFAPNGALKAMERLRDDKVVRFIGITGHYDRSILLQAIDQYPFDTLMLPLNAADVHYEPFQEPLLKAAVEKKMGIIAMKVAGKGMLVGNGKLTMEQAMQYVYSFPVSCAIIGIHTLAELYEDLEITNDFSGPLSSDELKALEDATESYHNVQIRRPGWKK